MRMVIALLLLGVAGLAAAATTYNVDAAHSTLGFAVSQTGADVQGQFKEFTAKIVFDEADLAGSCFDVKVNTRSVDTGEDDRDSTLRSADLLSVDRFPQAHFVTSGFTRKAPGQYEATGKLTIRDVTREIKVPFTFQKAQDATKPTAVLKGGVTVQRLDYGVGQGDWKDTSMVGNDVKVNFSLQLTGASAPKPVKQQ